MGEVKTNQYNFVLVVCGSHSISDEVKVLSNPRIPIGMSSATTSGSSEANNAKLNPPLLLRVMILKTAAAITLTSAGALGALGA